MERIEPALRSRPAVEGDVAYVSGPGVDLATRLALAAFVGDGLTTTALGGDGRTGEDVVALRPQKMIVSAEWLEAACAGRGPRWPAGLDRPWVRRRVFERLGDRLRWVETRSAVDEPTAKALRTIGVGHRVVRGGTGGAGPETDIERDEQTVH
jgi:hypothetical protein